jgi:hypothetical protein
MEIQMNRCPWIGAVAILSASLAQAQPLPTRAPESVGMSSERLWP